MDGLEDPATGAAKADAKTIEYTTGLKAPEFETQEVYDLTDPEQPREWLERSRMKEQKRRDRALAEASVRMLFETDLSRLDDAGAKGLYLSVTEGVWGIPDAEGAFFGKRGSGEDFRRNAELLRQFFKGDYRLAEDPEAEEFRKKSWKEKFEYALSHETAANALSSTAGGERGASLGELVYLSAVSSAQGGMSFTPDTGRPTETQKEASRKTNYETMTPEERHRYEADVIGDYERRLAKREPLMAYLRMAAELSDEGAYILAKSYNENALDVPGVLGLPEDEQAKVMTTYAQMKGDLKEGRILGIPVDFSTGTAGDRLQMGVYGLQQSVVSLGKDLYGLAEAGAMRLYAQTALDGRERADFYKAWNAIERAKLYEERGLPEADTFLGEAYQSFMENAHWIVPYGGAAKIAAKGRKASAAIARIGHAKELREAGRLADLGEIVNVSILSRMSPMADGMKYADETAARLLASVDRYTRELKELERMRLAYGAGKGALDSAWAVARGSAFAAFAQEYLETADAAGVSREESVLTAAWVGLINDRIERLYVPGLESTLTKGQLKSIGMTALRRSLQEGTFGEYAKNFMKRYLSEGVRVGVTEGWVEEPLQQLVLEHGKAVDKAEGIGNSLKALLKTSAKDLQTYLDTAAEMLPASFGFGVTTVPGQLVRRRIRNRLGARRTGLANYDEGIVGLYQREMEARRLIEESWRGRGEEEAARQEKPSGDAEATDEGAETPGASEEADGEQKELEAEYRATDAMTKARAVHDAGGDVVSGIAEATGVDVKTAEAIAQLLDEEAEVMRFDPRARSMVDQFFAGARIDEKTIATLLPGYVEGSFEADEENGVYVAKVRIGEDGGIAGGVRTIVYRRRDGVFFSPDGTLDEAALAKAAARDSSLGVSYDKRLDQSGDDGPRWGELSDADRRREALIVVNGRTDEGGTVAFRRKDGSEASVRADAIVNLATGRLADIGYGMGAKQATVRHETFHALWRFAKELLKPEEVRRLADALAVDVKAEGWEADLDEAMAHQMEEYASGHYVVNAVGTRFEAFQAWAARQFGGREANRVLDALPSERRTELGAILGEGTPFALEPFYEAVMSGRIGSGSMGIDRIVAPAKQESRAPSPDDELPVEGAKDEEQKTEEPPQQPAQPSQESRQQPPANTMQRPDWDKGTEVIKRVPKKDYRIHCKLEVVNIHDGIRTSWSEGFDDANQGRDITSDESAALVEAIAGNPDYSKGGTVMEFTGTGAPLVAPNGDVLDGNHHMRGLQIAYERGGERIEAFREKALAEAAARGLPVDEHAAEAPVIICRVVSVEVNEGEAVPTIAQIAEDTNDNVQRGLNVYETAAKDARILVANNLIQRFQIDPETGLIKDEEERKVKGQSVDPVGVFRQKSGAQGIVKDGKITEEGQKRLMNAILAALLGGTDSRAVESIMEKGRHLDMENEMRALMRMAPQLLALVNDPAKKGYDLRPDILEALTWYQSWRDRDESERARSGKSKAEWRKAEARPTAWANYKGDMFSQPSPAAAILGDLFAASQSLRSFQQDGETDTKAGAKRAQELIVKELQAYLENVYATNTDTDDMFGDFTPPTKEEVLRTQREKNERYSVAARLEEERRELEARGGRLLLAHHGTDSRGFTEFSKTEDVGYFFARSRRTAKSYIRKGSRGDGEKPGIPSREEMLSFLGDGAEGLSYRELVDEYLAASGETSGVYDVALRMENPYEVDAKGSNWDAVYDIPDEEGTTVYDVVEVDYDPDLESYTLRSRERGKDDFEESGYESLEDLRKAMEARFGEDFADTAAEVGETDERRTFTLVDGREEKGPRGSMWAVREGTGWHVVPQTTRELVMAAREMGHDGLLVRNVLDNGGGIVEADVDDIYAVMDPAQAKLVDEVTYADDGSIVPEEERLDWSDRDVRYSVAQPEEPEMRRAFPERLTAAELDMIAEAGGTRDEASDIGFILPDGRMIPYSSHIGILAPVLLSRGIRFSDANGYRMVGTALDSGAVRVGGLGRAWMQIGARFTPEQEGRVWQYFEERRKMGTFGEDFVLELKRPDGDFEHATYSLRVSPQRIIDDARAYYERGEVPAGQSALLSRFHFSTGYFRAAERKALKYLPSLFGEGEAKRIKANLRRLRGTPWYRQALSAILIRKDMEDVLAGREPSAGSKLTLDRASGALAAIRRGREGVFSYLQANGVVGHASKPVNSVNGSFIDCEPSEECALYCYATRGNYAYPTPAVKGEMISWAVKEDPVRVAEMIVREYRCMPEYDLGKALRLFDRGDMAEEWIPLIRYANDKGIRFQIFSKRPELLAKVDAERNILMLSVDRSNLDVAEKHKDLPISFAFSDERDIPFLERQRGRFERLGGVILPIATAGGKGSAPGIGKLPEWARPYVCPVNSGKVEVAHRRGDGGWTCTNCDARTGNGVGCFYHRTSEMLSKLDDRPLTEQDREDVDRRINELEEFINERCRDDPALRDGLLENLAHVRAEIWAHVDATADGDEPGEAEGARRGEPGAPGAGRYSVAGPLLTTGDVARFSYRHIFTGVGFDKWHALDRQVSVWVVPQDGRGRPLSRPVPVFKGTATFTTMHPREMFADAMKWGAPQMAVVRTEPVRGTPYDSPAPKPAWAEGWHGIREADDRAWMDECAEVLGKKVSSWTVIRSDGAYRDAGEERFSDAAAFRGELLPPRGRSKFAQVLYPDAGIEVRSSIVWDDYAFGRMEGPVEYSVGARRAQEIRRLFAKHRPDVDPADVMAYIEEIGRYDDPKKEKLAVHWLLAGSIEIPEDNYKLEKALKTAERAKVDPFQYRNPEDIFEAFPQHLPKESPTDPDKVPELVNRREMGRGIVVYDLDESEDTSAVVGGEEMGLPAAQLAMRRIVNTHWGRDASPWCLLQADDRGNLTRDALSYWGHYSAKGKRVAFRDGRLLAFMATDGNGAAEGGDCPDEWWDRKDQSHVGIPFEGRVEGDPLGRSASQELRGGRVEVVGNLWKGSRRNGLYEEWTQEGAPLESSEWRDGKLHGHVTRWWADSGALKELGDYTDGMPTGDLVGFDQGGVPTCVEHYGADGRHDAPTRNYFRRSLTQWTGYDQDGHYSEIAKFYGEGGPSSWRKYGAGGNPLLRLVEFTGSGRLSYVVLNRQAGGGRATLDYVDGRLESVRVEGAEREVFVQMGDGGRVLGYVALDAKGGHAKDGHRDDAGAPATLRELAEREPVLKGLEDEARAAVREARRRCREIYEEDLRTRGFPKEPRFSSALARAKRRMILMPKSAIPQMEFDFHCERTGVVEPPKERPKKAAKRKKAGEAEPDEPRPEPRKGARYKAAVKEANAYQEFIDKYRPLYERAMREGDWKPALDFAEESGMPFAGNVLKEYYRDPEFDMAELAGTRIGGVEDAAAVLMAVRSPFVESVKALYLDIRRRVLDAKILTIGQPGQSAISKGTVLRNMPPRTAYAIISHNHPSGDPSPSGPDKKLTMGIKKELKGTKVKLLDHIITDGDRFYSFNYQDVIPIDVKRPAWEVLPAGGTGGPTFTTNDQVLKFAASHLRDDGGYGHVIYLNGRLGVVGVRRIPPAPADVPGRQDWARVASEGAESSASRSVIVDLGPERLSDAAAKAAVRAASPWFGEKGLDLMDAVCGSAETGGIRSLRCDIGAGKEDWAAIAPVSEPVDNIDRFEYPRYSIASRRIDWEDVPDTLESVVLSTTVAHLTGQDRHPLHYLRFKAYRDKELLAEARPMVEKWAADPPTHWLGTYLLAKYYGDLKAAEAVARHHMNARKANVLGGYLKKAEPAREGVAAEPAPVRWVYVRNDDGRRTNRIPEAYAALLAETFGGVVDTGIAKVSDERNTSASIKSRVGREFQFAGEPAKDAVYVIVDDVWTTGQTAVSLMEYLEKKGANVAAITTLAVASNGARIKPTGAQLAGVLRKGHVKSVEDAEALTGVDLRRATGSELQAYIVKGKKGQWGLEAWFGSAAPSLPLDFRNKGGRRRAGRNDLFAHLTAEQRGRIQTKPTQGVFAFSTAFPHLSELGDDQLIAAAHAARAATKYLGSKLRIPSYDAIRRDVERAHPDASEEDVRMRTMTVQGEALKLARKIREGLDKGVSESSILKALNDSMKPTFMGEMRNEARAGAKAGAYGAHAEETLDRRLAGTFDRAVRVQAGVDADLFEEWAGVDFAETLWKVLRGELAEKPPPSRRREGGVTDGDEGGTGGGGGEAEAAPSYPAKELESPRKFAEYIRDLAGRYWKEKRGLGQDADPWQNRIAVQFLRRTAQNVYTRLVDELTYSRSRDTAYRAIQRMDSAPTVAGLVSQMAYVGEIIHARHIRERKEELLKELDNLLKTSFGATGRFRPDREELRRKVTAEMELRARYMRHAMYLTPDAASDEAGELSRALTSAATMYEEAERDVEQSRVYVETIRKLHILREFGALRYKSLGEVESALEWWREQAAGSGAEVLRAFEDREARTKNAAAILGKAFFNPSLKHKLDRGFRQGMNNYLTAHMGFASLLQDMCRFAPEADRAEAYRIIEYLSREIQKAGDRSAAEMRRHGADLHRAVESIYGMPFRKVMAAMNREAPEFAPFMGTKGGHTVTPTKGRAMQLLVSLLQGAKPGSAYHENVKHWRREGQAERIADLLSPQDMNMLKWIGQWYEVNRRELSDVSEALFGIGVYSEAHNYFPVRMQLARQGLEKVEGVAWTVFPKALTPRVRNLRDFDTETDVFALWASRMEEASQWKGHAKLGLELRGIFGRSELQETVAANHGARVNSLMLGFITDILAGHGAYDRTTSGIEWWSDQIRGWTALCALGGNLGVMLKQTTSIPAFGFEIGLVKTARYAVEAFTPAGMEAMGRIFASEQRKTRWQVGNTEAVKNALARSDAGWFRRAMQASMITNKLGDIVPALVVGQGIYRDCLARGMGEENAMAQTWMLIERTQQSGRMENQTSVQRRNRLGRMLYQFLTTQQQYLQYEVRAIRQAVASPSAGSAGRALNAVVLNHFILSSLYYWAGELYKAMLGSEPPKDQLADWVVACLLGPYASLYVLGFACRATLDRFLKGSWTARGEDMLPMESFIKSTADNAARVVEAAFDDERTTDELIDELARLASGLNPVVRDVRKAIGNAGE